MKMPKGRMIVVTLLIMLMMFGGKVVFGGEEEEEEEEDHRHRIEYVTNVTVDNPEDFEYRDTRFVVKGTVAHFRSTSVGADGTKDVIIGACYGPSSSTSLPPPTAWLAYYSSLADREDEIETENENENEDPEEGGEGESEHFEGESKHEDEHEDEHDDVKDANGFVATIYSKIEEIDSSNNVVKEIMLNHRNFSQISFNTSGEGEELKWVSFTSEEEGYKIKITFVVSSVLGLLQAGNATITPKSMESYIQITNYPYTSPTNHLNLTLFLVNRSRREGREYEETKTVIAGEGKDQVHFRLAEKALVDGVEVEVEIDGLKAQNINPSETHNPFLQSQLRGGGRQKAEIRKVVVGFPDNAVNIFYDPAMGFSAPNSASLLLPSLSLSLSLFVLSFFSLFLFF